MPRYAVLLDPQDHDLRPVALVTEHQHEVRVHFAVPCGLKSEYRAPYEVMEPDGEVVRYEPGRDEYFNSVITTLSRGFVVNELEPIESLDVDSVAALYVEKVLLPRANVRGAYLSPPARGAAVYVAPEPEETPAAQAAGSLLACAT